MHTFLSFNMVQEEAHQGRSRVEAAGQSRGDSAVGDAGFIQPERMKLRDVFSGVDRHRLSKNVVVETRKGTLSVLLKEGSRLQAGDYVFDTAAAGDGDSAIITQISWAGIEVRSVINQITLIPLDQANRLTQPNRHLSGGESQKFVAEFERSGGKLQRLAQATRDALTGAPTGSEALIALNNAARDKNCREINSNESRTDKLEPGEAIKVQLSGRHDFFLARAVNGTLYWVAAGSINPYPVASGKSVIVGRGVNADIKIPDGDISVRHLEINDSDGRVSILNTSRHGTATSHSFRFL